MAQKKVLICDDEPQLREMIASWLCVRGYAVMEASDGVECMQMLKCELPDLLLLDINMPRASGIDVLRKLESLDLQLPVIVFSGGANKINMSQLAKLGQDNFVTKPFAISHLMSKIERIC